MAHTINKPNRCIKCGSPKIRFNTDDYSFIVGMYCDSCKRLWEGEPDLNGYRGVKWRQINTVYGNYAEKRYQ